FGVPAFSAPWRRWPASAEARNTSSHRGRAPPTERLRRGRTMTRVAAARRDHIRAMLADLRMPGALEAVDEILAGADGGALTAAEAIERLLNAQITLRNNRRLQTAMRSSRLPAIKTLE